MSKHLIWISITAVVLSVPLVPDSNKISISIDSPKPRKTTKPYDIITTMCHMEKKTVNDQGLQICEYRCDAGDKHTIYKTSMPSVVCKEHIQEQIKQTKR